ncbi:MAG TPA: hypothetical protein DD437_04040 [Rhodobiaceae bacterium]|jgi:hypothetical protein|nr:hypothetical protein [Rhodobiaceae bacterium]
MWDAQTRVVFKKGQKKRQFHAFFGTDIKQVKHNTSSKPEDKATFPLQQGENWMKSPTFRRNFGIRASQLTQYEVRLRAV